MNIKHIQYQTDYLDTHEYIGGTVKLTQDPKDPERYVIPQGQYLEKPPKPKKGYQIIRQNDAWEYVKDYRGVTLYILDDDKEYTVGEYEIKYSSVYNGLGELPDYLTAKERPKPEDKQKGIREERETLLQALDEIVMNPFRFQELSEETKQKLQEYRQLLLDITEQEGFPVKVKFPEVPQILKKKN